MNRRFRLAAVERLRASKLADAARALGEARRELATALGSRDKIRDELQRTATARNGSPAEQFSASERRARLREELVIAMERCTAAQSQEFAALAAWNSARSDLRAVEMLHERHRLSLAEAGMRCEQREIDEHAALSHRRSSTDTGFDGPAGLDGLDGLVGLDGLDGLVGLDGLDGEDA